MSVILRAPTPADAEPCGRIIYDAFRDIATRHGFSPDFPNTAQAIDLARMLIQNPSIFGIVAERDGRIAGSNFVSDADPIAGIGPITVDPAQQGAGIGKRLMESVIDRAKSAPGIRLVQDAFNSRSMSLYTSLGFDVKEPLVMIDGLPKSRPRQETGLDVRPMQPADVDGCIDLCRRVHHFDRANELRHTGPFSKPWVVVRDGRITAYATALNFWAFDHGVADSEQDMQALLLEYAAAHPDSIRFLLPTRQSSFFRWCLSEGLRVIKPMTLMAMGEYQEPRGCWFPSVMY